MNKLVSMLCVGVSFVAGCTSSAPMAVPTCGSECAAADPWAQQRGTPQVDLAYGIAADSLGNVVAAGMTRGNLSGPGRTGDDADLALVKYDLAGNEQWAQQLGTSFDDSANALAADRNGNLYLAGETWGDLAGNGNAGEADLFVVKYAASGTAQWKRQLGTTVGDFAAAVALDQSDNVYVAGFTYGDLAGTNAGQDDVFVMKYSAGGTWQWTQQFGTPEQDRATSIAVDTSGNAYVTGWTAGDLAGAGTHVGKWDIFVAKYDALGARQWIQSMGSSEDDAASGIAVDASGGVYVAGYTHGSLGGQSLGMTDFVLAKFDGAGVIRWLIHHGTDKADWATAVAAGAGAVYVTGETYGALGATGNAGSGDLFLVKYSTDGIKQQAQQFGTAQEDWGQALAMDNAGNLYLAGATEGDLVDDPAGGYDFVVLKCAGECVVR